MAPVKAQNLSPVEGHIDCCPTKSARLDCKASMAPAKAQSTVLVEEDIECFPTMLAHPA
jgi:hypothetical protein